MFRLTANRPHVPLGWLVSLLTLALSCVSGSAQAPFVSYQIQEGDTPASVAAHLGIPVPGLLAQVGAELPPGQEIELRPPGAPELALSSKYVNTDIVVQAGQTLLTIAEKLDMTMEELADFNGIPRRYHLVQGETTAQIAQRYAASLAPIAQAYGCTPEYLLCEWNDTHEMEELPEGLLLTVGWEEVQEGDRLAYPLVEELRKDVVNELREANGEFENGQVKLWDDKATYQVYVVEPGDTLESIAERLKTTAKALRKANGMSEEASPEEGQPLFVPSSAMAGSQLLFRCEVKKDTKLRWKPDTSAQGGDMKTGETFYVYEAAYRGDWFAALTAEEDPKKMWAWVSVADVDLDLSQVYYAPGIPAPQPPQPKPDQPRIWPPPAQAPTARIQRLLEVAQTYLGTPYRMGGESRRAIDCSAFVMTCFRQVGAARLPRTALEQQRVGAPVPRDQIQAGDRLYFDFARNASSGRRAPGVADHTGIYIGGGQFIHATPPRARINKLQGSYSTNLIGIRRDV